MKKSANWFSRPFYSPILVRSRSFSLLFPVIFTVGIAWKDWKKIVTVLKYSNMRPNNKREKIQKKKLHRPESNPRVYAYKPDALPTRPPLLVKYRGGGAYKKGRRSRIIFGARFFFFFWDLWDWRLCLIFSPGSKLPRKKFIENFQSIS